MRTGKFDFWLYNINAQCTGDVLQLRTQIIEHIISDEDYVGKINTWNNNIISCSTQAMVDLDVLTESI